MIYSNIKKLDSQVANITHETYVEHNFSKGANVIIKGEDRYMVEFKDDERILHDAYLKGVPGHTVFTNCSIQYYIPYNINVLNLDKRVEILNETLDLKGKRVVIELSSSALGDTIAWFPYIDQFQKKHDCGVIAVTHHNRLFRDAYPNIKFEEPGHVADNIYAWYEVGWFYDEDTFSRFKHPAEFKSQPMQKTAADILGLDYEQLEPTIVFDPSDRPIQEKYITIGYHATSQAKYWNNTTGWQEVIDYLVQKGYGVVLLSKEESGYMGNENPSGIIYPKDHKMGTVMNYIHHSEMFVGLGSGLSWLAWALGQKVVLISGFSEDYTEMTGPTVTRIGAPEGKCRGCFNRVKLENSGGWNWCPDHYGSRRQFECTTSIKGQHVIDKISQLL